MRPSGINNGEKKPEESETYAGPWPGKSVRDVEQVTGGEVKKQRQRRKGKSGNRIT